jgi:hypothetical protein
MSIRDLKYFCMGSSTTCACFGLRHLVVLDQNNNTATSEPTAQQPEETLSVPEIIGENSAQTYDEIHLLPSHVGRWCIVNYRDRHYPGQIVNIDDEQLKVNCMNKTGYNRFYWPIFKNQLWYNLEDIMAFIDEPMKNGRHYAIAQDMYAMFFD